MPANTLYWTYTGSLTALVLISGNIPCGIASLLLAACAPSVLRVISRAAERHGANTAVQELWARVARDQADRQLIANHPRRDEGRQEAAHE